MSELSAQQQQERLWRKKWVAWSSRCQLRSVIRAWGVFIRACRPAMCEFDDTRRGSSCFPGIPPAQVGTSHVQDSDVASADLLGIDVATYRLLRQLEDREIVPEDYELLGSLHAGIKPATLTRADLKSFPTEMYCSAHGAADQNCTNQFGFHFWRLPTPPLNVEEEQQQLEHCEVTESYLGPGFWRLPIPAAEDGADDAWNNEICAICYTDLGEGDAVRRLQPCGHCFHRDCIDPWLLESSTKCPVDQQEVTTAKRW